MYFKLPDTSTEEITMLMLDGKMLSTEDVREMCVSGNLKCHVEGMVMSMVVSNDHSELMYRLLNTGQCTMGLGKTEIYRIVVPIQVEDIEGRKFYRLLANLVHIEQSDETWGGIVYNKGITKIRNKAQVDKNA